MGEIRQSKGGRAVVVGASGGIGRALAQALEQRGLEVIGLIRTLGPGLPETRFQIDLEQEQTIAAAAAAVGADAQRPITHIFVATGVLHLEGLGPERSNAALDPTQLGRLFAINAIGPALVAKHFLPLLPRHGRSVFAALSARVGSIGDNRLGGWHSYRTSKAALNMLIRTMAIELARTRPEAILVGLHPGTVDTGLSKPFQAAVPAGKLFSPAYAAERLLAVADSLGVQDSGGVFAWDGAPIPP